jgi:amino acid adenylation domain-containing protein
VTGTTLRYRELRNQAASLGATLERYTPDGGPPLTAVFAHQSSTAFAGVLATLLRGHGYVPLNRTFPPVRTRAMLERSGCRALIVDRESSEQLAEVLGGLAGPLLILLPEHDDVRSFRERWPQHVLVCAGELEPAEAFQPETPDQDSIAYLLFTSGSTGTPKGVMVAQRNVRHFVDVMVERYGITEQDRFSQTFDLTFDLSAFDMFVAWERGACLCRPSHKTLLNPGRFIQESKLTMWFSVPSVGAFMKRLGMLKPDMYPTLRWSLFCGEPLLVEIASAWAQAAPNSILENLYGPTELTIACTLYRWDAKNSPAECNLGVVPIGWPYPGMEAMVVNDSLQEVAHGQEGELLVAGPQRSLGYWQDAVKTDAAFVHVPDRPEIFYRTGDRVRRPVGANPLVYLGRLDHQVKIQGYRVELGEVEAHLRQEANVEAAVALGWPVTPSGAAGIVAFVGNTTLSQEELRARLRTKLPGYAVPREIRVLPQLPLNANGKVDRNALLKLLEGSA